MKYKAIMKPANCFSFVLDMIGERWKQFILVIFMGVISFSLVDLCVMTVLENQRVYLQVNELFHVSPEMVYNISDANLANLDDVKESLFEKELADSDLWSQICAYGFSNIRVFSELSQNAEYMDMMEKAYEGTMEQKMTMSTGDSMGEYMDVCVVNQNVLDIFDIHLPEAVSPKGDVIQGEDLIPIYPGSSFRGILEPGQVMASPYLDFNSVKNPDGISLVSYYVAGFLEKDTMVLSDHYLGGTNVATSLNAMILICEEDVKAAGYMVDTSTYQYRHNIYAVLSAEELPAFQYEMRHLYEKYNKRINMLTIPEMIRENNTVMESLKVLIMLAVLITLSGFLAFSTTSIISVLLRRRKFGIMLANGVSHRDIHVMVILETLLKYLLSLLIAFCVMHVIYMENTSYAYTGIDYQMTYLHMHVQYALPLLIFFCIMGIIVSVMIPVQIVKGLNITELLREN